MRVKALFLYFMFDGAVTNCEQAHKHLQNLVQQNSAEESPVKLFILNYERTVQKVNNTCEYNPQKVAAAAGPLLLAPKQVVSICWNTFQFN